MANIPFPADIRIGRAAYGIEFDVQINVMRNGSITTYGLPGARWTAAINFEPGLEELQGPAIEALVVSLEGGTNRLTMHHWRRPVPRGTLRGAPTVGATAAAGAKQIQLANANGTVKRGDILGILGQMVMVTADASPSGSTLVVNFSSTLRNPVTIGSPVVWNRPTVNWIPKTSIAGPFLYQQNGVHPGYTLDLVEAY